MLTLMCRPSLDVRINDGRNSKIFTFKRLETLVGLQKLKSNMQMKYVYFILVP